MTRKKGLISMCAALALVMLLLLGAGFCAVEEGDGGFAYVAGTYGGKDATEFWYYQDDALGLYKAKEVVDGWKDALRGSDPVVIAVVDTGLTVSHTLFDDVLLRNADGKVLGDNSTVEDDGGDVDISDTSDGRHGNAVAGIIAMLIREMGLEDFIKIYPIKSSVKKTQNGKTEERFSIANVTEALKRASGKAKADVINLSLGIPYENTEEWANDAQLAYAVEQALNTSFIVAAAGNHSEKANAQREDGAFYPAALDGVFSVMGYGEDLGLHDTSNYGALYDIAAPAEDIYTATDVYGTSGYGFSSGTSMATPFVSFAAALLKLRYRAEGQEDPSPQMIARLLRSFDFESFIHDGSNIRRLNLYTEVSQPLDEIELNYVSPTGVKITHDGKLGEGEYANAIYYLDPRSVPSLNFVASLSPYGMTDPDLDEDIEWVLRRNGEEKKILGTGPTLSYTPDVFGDTEIVARLSFNHNIEGVQALHVEYLKFVAGDARVTYAEYADTPPREAPTSGVLYTQSVTVFSFTGAKYMDPDVEIKWYVDREYVASGATFSYKPKRTGEHIISMQFGDNPPTYTPGVAFTATVKPFILRPLDMSMAILGGVILIASGITVAAIISKRKRAASQPAAQDEASADGSERKKPRKQKKEKPDKNVKIAKR